MTNKQEIQTPKITRNSDGTYLAKFEIEGTSKDELEEIFKEVEEVKKWNYENCRDNIWGGLRNGKRKNATKHITEEVEKDKQELIAKVLNGRLVMGEYWNDEEENYDV